MIGVFLSSAFGAGVQQVEAAKQADAQFERTIARLSDDCKADLRARRQIALESRPIVREGVSSPSASARETFAAAVFLGLLLK